MIFDHALIAAAALLASAVTFFSGFGLGTALLPAFAAFLPTDVAIGMVAIVHLTNNALKLGLLRGHVVRRVFVRFGVPALVFAPLGAYVLSLASDRAVLSYRLVGTRFDISALDAVIALLLVVLGVQELVPRLSRMTFSERYLVVGGAASGFLGGLAGLQGALRSAFLIRAGVSREQFIATGVAVGLIVDVSRITTYAVQGTLTVEAEALSLAATGIVAASVGAIIGSRLLPSVTIRGVQIVVGVMLVVVAAALGAGLI